MKKVTELLVFTLLGVMLIMLGSIYQVSNAQTAEESDEVPTDAELQLLRNKLISESVMIQNYETFEENRNVLLSELKAEYDAEIEAKKEAERLAKIERERKAREEAKRKAKEEAERRAKEEADKKAKAEADAKQKAKANAQAQLKAKQQIKADTQQQTLYVTATAYTATCNGCSGVTASGYNVQNTIYYQGMRVIAADTSLLPLGTVVEIQGVGKAVVLDRGGAIKGNKIDLLVASTNDALNFGRKYELKLTVIGSIPY